MEQTYKAKIDRETAYLRHIEERLSNCRQDERSSLRLDKEVVQRKIVSLQSELRQKQEEMVRNMEIGLEMARKKRKVQEAMFLAGRQPPPPPPPLL